MEEGLIGDVAYDQTLRDKVRHFMLKSVDLHSGISDLDALSHAICW